MPLLRAGGRTRGASDFPGCRPHGGDGSHAMPSRGHPGDAEPWVSLLGGDNPSWVTHRQGRALGAGGSPGQAGRETTKPPQALTSEAAM